MSNNPWADAWKNLAAALANAAEGAKQFFESFNKEEK